MTDEPPSPIGPRVYSGMVNTWECDEMGHMNVRFYVAKAEEGVANLLALAGLGARAAAAAGIRLEAEDHHIRYLRELRPGAGVTGFGAFADVREDGFTAVIELRKSLDLAVSSSVLIRINVAGGALPGPVLARMRDTAYLPRRDIGPRSVALEGRGPAPSLDDVRRLDLACIRMGALQAEQFEEGGRLKASEVIGLVSDGIPNLVQRQREQSAEGEGLPRVGGAALEYRLAHRGRSVPGAPVGVFSGRRALGEKTFHMVHWVFDLETGASLATAEAVAIAFDLVERKAIAITPQVRTLMSADLKPDLWV